VQVIVCSDGLLANEERGGGGGLSNQQAIDICNGATGCSAQEVADELCKAAQAQGSTDDVTVALMRLRL
jgi:protein phosphatase 1L